jgi:hypothetical protein
MNLNLDQSNPMGQQSNPLASSQMGQCEMGSQGPGYVYDPEGEGPPSFPDVPELLDNVSKILTYMCEPEMVELKKKSKEEYTLHMEQQFPDFSFRYYTLFLKLMSGEDITPLMYMLAMIEKVKSGELLMEDAEKAVGEGLARQYILPKLSNPNGQ